MRKIGRCLKFTMDFSKVSFLDLFHNFNENNFYRLRSQPAFQLPKINTTLKGIESVRYFVRNSISIEIRSIINFDTFEIKIRKWKPTNCSCRLCKRFRFTNIDH